MKPLSRDLFPLSRQHHARRAEAGRQGTAIRLLAEELKVARKTVETAYAILTGEGYLVSGRARDAGESGSSAARAKRPHRTSDRHAAGVVD